MEKITFRELLATIHIDCDVDSFVEGMSDRSQDVKKNWLFISMKGNHDSGENYLEEVLAKGAYVLSNVMHDDKRIFFTDHIHKQAAKLLDCFYQKPYLRLFVIGVTGTSGKTSVSMLAKQLLQEDFDVMVIGTQGIEYHDQVFYTGNTTPSLNTLLRAMDEALACGITHIVMEVSSHAIATHRIGNIRFDAIIYTSITSDHLDFHLTRSQYRYTKFKLRYALKAKGVVFLHNDNQEMREFYDLTTSKIITYGRYGAHYTVQDVRLSDHDCCFMIHDYYFESQLLSIVNVLNLAVIIAMGRWMGLTYSTLQERISKMKGIAGRLQCIKTDIFSVWIDYAHTADALKNILCFANEVCEKNIICVVGCGGERDRSKRSIMAGYAIAYSHLAILTTDNPRNEWIPDILDDMCPKPDEHTIIIEDRRCALKHAVKNAHNGDIIIVAGRGDEKIQSIYGQRILFHDQSVLQEILSREEVPWISNI